MGKNKEHRGEPPIGAFSRMNYLYQAAYLMSRTSNNFLSNYYNKIMKDISKKVVEKLHPDLKRTICSACNYPLTADGSQINAKLKPFRKKKTLKILNSQTVKYDKKKTQFKKTNNLICKYNKSRIEARNKRPNKIIWSCCKCGYSKCFLQQPFYKLWINRPQNFE